MCKDCASRKLCNYIDMRFIVMHMDKNIRRVKRRSAYFLLPSIIGVAVFFVLPFLVVIYYSLIDNPISGKFVFLQNFYNVLTNKAFRLAMMNTFRFSVIAVPLVMVLSLGIAFRSL